MKIQLFYVRYFVHNFETSMHLIFSCLVLNAWRKKARGINIPTKTLLR